jgi:tetratricopeptide (TPR) repeat protein
MVYDIFPPMLFLLSMAGTVIVVSRVVMRVRHQQFSATIKSAYQDKPVNDDHILGAVAPKKGVQLFKNRFASVGGAVTRWREQRAQAKLSQPEPMKQVTESKANEIGEPKQIQQPKKNWRDRLPKFSLSKLSDVTKSIKEAVPARVKVMKTAVPVTPAVTPPAMPAVTLTRTTASLLQKVTQPKIAKPKKLHPLQRAKQALKEAKYDEVEDILLPYIVQHSADTKAYMLLGNAAVAREQWGEAVEIFKQVTKLDNTIIEAYAELGKAAQKDGQLTTAIESLQKAHNENPGDIEVLEALLKIAKHMDNRVLRSSVEEKLQHLENVDKEKSQAA